ATSSPRGTSATGVLYVGCVDKRFFDMVNYALCSALSDLLGRPVAERIFRKAGEVLYQELKRRGIVAPSEDPAKVMEQVARFLESSGYVERIEIERVSEEELVVDMKGVSVLESSMRLVNERKEPSHIMTNTMFAALKEAGYEAELEELLFDPEANRARERWKLRKKG
ncbi:MAG: hypothetical protein ABWW70_01055, partial [Thermoproteota archaeon]